MLHNLHLKKIIVGLTASVAVSGFIIGLRHQGSFEQIELLAYDFLVRLDAKSGSDARITIVGINKNTLQKINRDKISDRTLKQVLETIAQYKPRVIAIDIIRDIPIGEGRDELLNYVNNRYQPLEAAIKPIIFPCALPSENKPNGIAPPPVIDLDSAIGYIDLETDPQDIFGRELIRRASISSIPVNIDSEIASKSQFDAKSPKYLCNAPFSFSFLTALSYIQAQQIETLSPDSTPDITEFLDLTKIVEGEIKFKSLTFRPLKAKTGSYHNLDPSFYQYLIDYRYTQPGEIISLTKVLENQVTPQQFRDKVVLIGYTTRDNIQQTPFGSHSGVLVHGWMVSQLLSNVLERQPQIWTWSEPVEWLWILGWGIAGSIVALGIRPVGILVCCHGIAIAVLWGSCWFLFTQQGWIPLIPPFFSFAISSVLVNPIYRVLVKALTSTIPFSDRSTIDFVTTLIETIKIIKETKPYDTKEDLFIGKTIGDSDRYFLKQLLGKGGMSKVYLALDKNLNNKKVAIKIMTSYFSANDQDSIRRFIGEIEKLCMLNHPNIIQIKEKGVTPNTPPFFGYPFYVMEYFEGKTLQQLLNEKGEITRNLALQIIFKVCHGLKQAHKQGIIHRDIKPGNIFLSAGDSLGEVVKIIDFGIAKKINKEAQENTQSTVGFIGTYRYASPEQIRGASIDSRTDIYSLGVVFYETISSNYPYIIQDNYDYNTQVPKPLREQPGCQNIPVELENIVMKCLSKYPQNRFQSIEELEEALRDLL